MPTKYLAILAGLLVVAGAALGAIMISQRAAVKPATIQNSSAGRQTISSSQPEGIDISNWQTYRNKEYGFELKYPASWFIIQDKAPELIIGSAKMPIKLSELGDIIPPRDSAAIDFGYSASALENYGMTPREIYIGPSKDDVIIFEEKFYDQTTGSLGATASYWKNDPKNSQYEKIFDLMITSLKFINFPSR